MNSNSSQDESSENTNKEVITRISLRSIVDKNDTLYSIDKDITDYVDHEEHMDQSPYRLYPGTESENYDFAAERPSSNATNLFESTAHLIKGCLGAGILSMHVGFMFSGLWTGLIITIIIGTLVSHTMMMLVNSAHRMYPRLRVPKLSYPDLAEAAIAIGPRVLRRFKKTFRHIVDFCLFAKMCGSCCIYQIMIAKTLKRFLESMSVSIKDMNLDLEYYILIVAVPLIILCLIRSLKYLAPFSVAADIVLVIAVITTMYYSLKEVSNISDRPAWRSVQGLFRCCGICLYSVDGVVVVMPLENSMRSPHQFYIVLKFGMTIVVAMVMCTGFFGYWAWGEACKSPITLQLPTGTVPIVIQVLLAVMLSVTFAVSFWVPFHVVWYYVGRKHKRKRQLWENIYKILHVCMITCLGVAFPNLNRLIIFVGSFFLAFTVFIFPAIISSFINWKEPRKGFARWAHMKNGLIIIIGLVFCSGAFYSSLDIP